MWVAVGEDFDKYDVDVDNNNYTSVSWDKIKNIIWTQIEDQ